MEWFKNSHAIKNTDMANHNLGSCCSGASIYIYLKIAYLTLKCCDSFLSYITKALINSSSTISISSLFDNWE